MCAGTRDAVRECYADTPQRPVPGGSLCTQHESIVAVAADRDRLEASANEEVIDGGGAFLAPGFVDLRVHGVLHRATTEGSEEAFDEILRFHARGGTANAAPWRPVCGLISC